MKMSLSQERNPGTPPPLGEGGVCGSPDSVTGPIAVRYDRLEFILPLHFYHNFTTAATPSRGACAIRLRSSLQRNLACGVAAGVGWPKIERSMILRCDMIFPKVGRSLMRAKENPA